MRMVNTMDLNRSCIMVNTMDLNRSGHQPFEKKNLNRLFRTGRSQNLHDELDGSKGSDIGHQGPICMGRIDNHAT